MTPVPNLAHDFLRRRGCDESVVKGGVPLLLDRWESFTAEVRSGYGDSVNAYRHDLDARQLLHEVAAAGFEFDGAQASRLAAADARFRAGAEPSAIPVRAVVKLDSAILTASTHWWYFAKPKNMGEDFAAEWTEGTR